MRYNFFFAQLLFLFLSCAKPVSKAQTYSWEGKKIVWTGTSIPWQFAPNSYPEKIGRMLNAKVYNAAISGSTIIFQARDSTGKGNNGMAGTYAELISSKFPQNYSYENRIMPYLVHPYNADVVVIDHGHNDTSLLRDYLGTIDSRNKGTLYGAFNVIIDAVLKQKPDCKVILCTPPNAYLYGGIPGQVENFKRLRTAILAIGKRRNLPVWDMMERSGITGSNVKKWTTDNVHPNQAMTDSLAADGFKFFSSIDFDKKPVAY